MSVTPDQITPGIRALIGTHADHMAGHANPREHRRALDQIGDAAKQARDWSATAEDDDTAEFMTILAMLSEDDTRPQRGMTDADALRVIAQAAGDIPKGSQVLRDAMPAGIY